MREQIKKVATELLITHGVRGLRFGDIAERLSITRANIHYHFGTKKKLIEEVIEEYVITTLEQLGRIWKDPARSHQDKTRKMMEFNRTRYARFNPPGMSGRPWSLISRMRLEADQLSEAAQADLKRFTTTIEAYIDYSVEEALRKGELTPGAPARDIAVQLIAVVDSAGSITQDSGSFDRLERFYTAYLRIISHAYGGVQANQANFAAAANS